MEECDGALSLIAAVESSEALAVSPEFMMRVAGGRLRFVPFAPAPLRMKVGVGYLEGEAGDLVREFVAAAKRGVAVF